MESSMRFIGLHFNVRIGSTNRAIGQSAASTGRRTKVALELRRGSYLVQKNSKNLFYRIERRVFFKMLRDFFGDSAYSSSVFDPGIAMRPFAPRMQSVPAG